MTKTVNTINKRFERKKAMTPKATMPGSQPAYPFKLRTKFHKTHNPAMTIRPIVMSLDMVWSKKVNRTASATPHRLVNPPMTVYRLILRKFSTNPIRPISIMITAIIFNWRPFVIVFPTRSDTTGDITMTPAAPNWTKMKIFGTETEGSLKILLQANETMVIATNPIVGRLTGDDFNVIFFSINIILKTHKPTNPIERSKLATMGEPLPVGRLKGIKAAEKRIAADAYSKWPISSNNPKIPNGRQAITTPKFISPFESKTTSAAINAIKPKMIATRVMVSKLDIAQV